MSFCPEAEVCLPEEHSVCHVRSMPDRWDEFLDLEIPILIHHTCGEWSSVLAGLELSGLSARHVAHLVTVIGAVTELKNIHEAPQEPWCLVLGWTHPDQGWRSRLPLAGQTFVVTREESQGQSLLAKLRELGATAVAIPTICFGEPDDLKVLHATLPELPSFDWAIFTSANAVRYFFEHLENSASDYRVLSQIKLACIGPKTAEILRSKGFRCDLIPESHVAEGLLEAFQKELGRDLKGLRFFFPRAQEAREILPVKLEERGAEVTVVPVYQTRCPDVDEPTLNSLPNDAKLLFTSSSTVKNWVEMTRRTEFGCYCIGPITAKTATALGFEVLGVAEPHTVSGLINTLTATA